MSQYDLSAKSFKRYLGPRNSAFLRELYFHPNSTTASETPSGDAKKVSPEPAKTSPANPEASSHSVAPVEVAKKEVDHPNKYGIGFHDDHLF